MDFDLTDEQRLLKDSVDRLIADRYGFEQRKKYLAEPDGRPRVVIAHTIKGKGVSFMEDRAEWHHRVPTDEELSRALEELAR